MFAHTFTRDMCRVVSTHAPFLARAEAVSRFLFDFGFCERKQGSICMHDPAKMDAVFAAFDLERARSRALHLNHAVLQSAPARGAFCRGAFLAGGFAATPDRKYRVELLTPRRYLTGELLPLLREDGFEPSLSLRGSVYAMMFASSEGTEDFLTYIGAPVAALELMNTKAEKELRNSVNRRVNCESGNIARSAAAAARQLPMFERLLAEGALPPPLRETAAARVARGEDTLSELARYLGIGRSALQHRLRKLEEMYAALR
jgi:DNA-binding protein WhiA